MFPGFPICLETVPFYRLIEHSTCSQTALFRNFQRYVPYQKFNDVLEATSKRARGRPVGLVYPWQGITNGLILHNGDFPMKDFGQTIPWKDQFLTVRHFGRFLRMLAAQDWTLDSLRTPWRPTNNLEPVNGKWEIPSLLTLARLIPDRTEFLVLAQMLEILFHMPPDEQQSFIVRRGGERWIAVTQEWLAQQNRCSVRSIQRAVKGLEDKGFIRRHRSSACNNEMQICQGAFQ